MASARELLEQVDALMRRNREEAADAEIPVLTDVVIPSRRSAASETAPAANDGASEAVAEAVVSDGAVTHDVASIDSQPHWVANEGAVTSDVASIESPLIQSALAEPLTDRQRWERMAEDIRVQILQRIDIFTDTGLQEQLKAQLQPIVDRAGAELMEAINQQVGQLLSSYIADAIEREIDKWTQSGD